MNSHRRKFGYALLSLPLALSMKPAHAIEEPQFNLVESDGRIEVRDYAPYIVAEVLVVGDMATASNRGFRAIAGYIFGGNRSVRGGDNPEKIAMTAPVGITPASEKIAMTAPVGITPEAKGAEAFSATDGRWRVHFVMPRQYTMANLPKPNDPSVRLREVPSERWVVLRYSGFNGEDKLRENTDELLAWIARRGFKARGETQLARYDPPWTLPFMRRNELMVPVEKTP